MHVLREHAHFSQLSFVICKYKPHPLLKNPHKLLLIGLHRATPTDRLLLLASRSAVLVGILLCKAHESVIVTHTKPLSPLQSTSWCQ